LAKWTRFVVAVVTALAVAAGGLPAGADQVASRTFEDDTWDDLPAEGETAGWHDFRATDSTRTKLTTGFAGNGLQVRIPEGVFRGFGPFDRFAEPEMDQAWYRYHIRLISWNSADEGKLPGLSGLYSSAGRGCIRSIPGRPGWSARGMFGVAGTQGAPPGNVPIGTYLYHLDQPGDCGEELFWDGTGLEPGRWHCVEGHVKLNTPGSSNGQVQGWLDGTQRLNQTGLAFRRTGETQVGIRDLWHNVYFGGSWPTPNPLTLVIDQAVVSTGGRIGCLDPFLDDNDSVHVTALGELHARGVLFGCDYRQVCPDRQLTRGEVAALFSRVLGLPASSKDFFRDDQGHVFEGAHNKLAAAGITVGCTATAFCADKHVSRAQFATMAVRALGVPASGGDAFSDDDGHWAEAPINTLAAVGLTAGCDEGRFCPDRTLTRAEAATFFLRIANQLQPLGQASVEPPPDWPPPGDPPPIPPDEQD
jgi:hypothetical protein